MVTTDHWGRVFSGNRHGSFQRHSDHLRVKGIGSTPSFQAATRTQGRAILALCVTGDKEGIHGRTTTLPNVFSFLRRPARTSPRNSLTRMKSPRRYLTFSLRKLFVLLTALAVWLGVVVHRAREQREAVEAIEAAGGVVRYDWQYDSFVARRDGVSFDFPLSNSMREPSGPLWMRRFIGDEFFQQVWAVQIPRARSMAEFPALNPNDPWDPCRFWAYSKGRAPPRETEADIVKLIPHLQRLHNLKALSLPHYVGEFDTSLSQSAIDLLETSLPDCEIRTFYNGVPLFVP